MNFLNGCGIFYDKLQASFELLNRITDIIAAKSGSKRTMCKAGSINFAFAITCYLLDETKDDQDKHLLKSIKRITYMRKKKLLFLLKRKEQEGATKLCKYQS